MFHNSDGMRNHLEKITLKGFRTFEALENFEPGSLTVLIGPNGVGKSNFIAFFRMMSWALSEPGNLRFFVSERGGASKLLHDGANKTREIEAELTIRTAYGENQYSFRLVFAADDRLIFADERYRFSDATKESVAPWRLAGAGHDSPQILELAYTDTTARVIRNLLQRIVVYQFHNTSYNARMRGKWRVNDNRYLKEDAANIASVLFRLRENYSHCYQRVVDTLRLILPFFADFELEPDHDHLLLSWREHNCDEIFTVSQASDGMLRVLALVTLLLQSEQDLPDVLILDEPELGLHPYAINIIGGLIDALSTKIQVLVATQSMPLVDCFAPEDIVVVERADRGSSFQRLRSDDLDDWLEDYALSELWEKNVIGGRP